MGLLSRIRKAIAVWRVKDKVRSRLLIGPQPLYVYLDEAGDLDFARSGSRFFLCGVLVTYDPWPLMDAIGRLREELFRGGFIPQAFHATEDKQKVRDRVFQTITNTGGFEVNIFVVEKSDVPLSHRDLLKFYAFITDFALRMVLQWHPTDAPIFIVTDALPVQSKRGAIVKGLKASLSAIVPDRYFEIEHHSSGTQACLQVVDYVTWAVFRWFERGDDRSYVLIRNFIRREMRLDWTLVKSDWGKP